MKCYTVTMRTREYRSWESMKRRCQKPDTISKKKRYLDRGIVVCERWASSFPNFLEDMGARPDGTSLDRIDNNKGYEPGNCRWASPKMQSNNRENNRFITVDGITKTMAQWGDEMGLKRSTVKTRIYRFGWSVEDAVSTPAYPRGVTRCGNH